MIFFDQRSGEIREEETLLGIGYSGHDEGLGNPDMEDVHNVGPIPRGDYQIEPAFHHPTKGPCVMRLTPIGHDAHGRTEFEIHGDNSKLDFSASEGCIVASPKKIREDIEAARAAGEDILRVT